MMMSSPAHFISVVIWVYSSGQMGERVQELVGRTDRDKEGERVPGDGVSPASCLNCQRWLDSPVLLRREMGDVVWSQGATEGGIQLALTLRAHDCEPRDKVTLWLM